MATVFSWASACDSPPPHATELDAFSQDANDAHDAKDARDVDASSPISDASDTSRDAPKDTSEDDGSSRLPTHFFRDGYLCDSEQTPTPALESRWDFFESVRGGVGAVGKQELLDARGGEIDVDGMWMSAPSELAPGPNGYALWASSDEDITLYTGAFTKETDLEGARLRVTAMVDYELIPSRPSKGSQSPSGAAACCPRSTPRFLGRRCSPRGLGPRNHT
jgi:hypothetical protein